MDDLILYYANWCPYCQKVLRFMKNNGIEIALRSTDDAAARDELVRVGGKNQVPCLFVDGKPMYESGDIIEYLKGRL